MAIQQRSSPKADNLFATLVRIESYLAVYQAWRSGKDYKAVAEVHGVAECATAKSHSLTGLECLRLVNVEVDAWKPVAPIGSSLFNSYYRPLFALSAPLLFLELLNAGDSYYPMQLTRDEVIEQITFALQESRKIEIDDDVSEAWLIGEALKELSSAVVRAQGYAVCGTTGGFIPT